MNCYRYARLLLAGAALAVMSGPALALDGNDILTKLMAASNLPGSELKAASIEVNGDTVTYKGLTFKSADPQAHVTPIGELTLDDVEQQKDGSYHVGKASIPDIKGESDGTSYSVSDVYMSGIVIPADANTGTISSQIFYEKTHSGPIKVSRGGKELFSVSETSGTMDYTDDRSAIEFDAEVSDIKADLSVIDDPKSKEAIEKLGLTSLDGEIELKGIWEIATGKVDVKEYSLDFDNVGRLDLAFSFSGYTTQFMKSMQDTMQQVEKAANDEQAQQAANLAMLGLMQQLSFNSADIKFEDKNITKRALDYTGSQQGMTGEQMGQTIKAMTPIMMAQLNVPELQNAVSAAVNAFIDNPRSLRISAVPASPVPFPMIMGAAMGAPNTLPQILGLNVVANK